MTAFEITIIVLLSAIVVLLIVLLRTTIEGFHGVWDNQTYNYNELRKIVVSTSETLSDIRRQLKNIEGNIIDDLRKIRLADKCINDLAINVKGNYNTLEQQQESIDYIRMRVNHILSLIHPAEEVVKPDAPTALDGLSNVPKDNANKSTNYNGYDPTIIVRGSEITDKED